MEIIGIDDVLPSKDKNIVYQIDTSRTADSLSHIYQDEILPKEDNENNEIILINNKDDDEYRELITKLNNRKIQIYYDTFSFKKRLSIALCSIYYILFLMTIPKNAEKIGEEQNINILTQINGTKKIDILINSINFIVSGDKYLESSGFLLEFRTNKMYIFRWSIGFFYFIIKCICFVYSKNDNDNNSNNILDKKRINIIRKISMIFFPLSLFYYDFKNNISYTEIKVEKIGDKIISYYAMTIKRFTAIDYIEGLILTFLHFLISIDYDNLQKNINTYIIKRMKPDKLI
jgi:hypothetical protein